MIAASRAPRRAATGSTLVLLLDRHALGSPGRATLARLTRMHSYKGRLVASPLIRGPISVTPPCHIGYGAVSVPPRFTAQRRSELRGPRIQRLGAAEPHRRAAAWSPRPNG
jgi:hypothetical protein